MTDEVEYWKAVAQAHNDSLVERIEENAKLAEEVERLTRCCNGDVERERNELRAENEMLRGLLKAPIGEEEDLNIAVRANHAYERENKRLREALSFYAEHENYNESYIGGERVRSSVEIDGGDKAIAALQLIACGAAERK
jgi:hypothetical protein